MFEIYFCVKNIFIFKFIDIIEILESECESKLSNQLQFTILTIQTYS